MMNEQDEIKKCYAIMYQAMIQKNGHILEDILDDTFELVHMTGMSQSKNDFIQAVLNGTLNYYSAKHQSVDIKIETDDTARLDGKSIVDAAVFGGGKHTWKLRQKMSLIKRNGKWHIKKSVALTF